MFNLLAALALSVGTVAPSTGLHTLATTGWADDYAAEIGGKAYDETGGSPAMFTYAVETPWQEAAMAELNEGEFLAPHFAITNGGSVVVMIAPHLFVDGELMKGAGPDDNFITIDSAGNTERYDYSRDVAKIDG